MRSEFERAALALALTAALALLPTGADAADPPTHHLSGTISGGADTVQFRVDVTPFDPDNPDSLPTLKKYVGPGAFSFDVPDGAYLLHFNDEDGGASVHEYYDDSPTRGDATPVVVDGADVDLAAVTLTPLALVRGRLSAPAIPDLYQVRAYPADDYSRTSMRRGGSTVGWAVRLPPGDWKVQFVDEEGVFAPEWYGGANSFAEATVIHVDGTDLDLGLQRVSAGGTIEGFVRDSVGAPARKLQVTALDPDGIPYRTDVTTDSGHYLLVRLAPGPYTVQVSDEKGHLIPTTYFPASPVASGAQPVVMPEDALVDGRDVVVPRTLVGLPPGTDIAGRVVDQEGQPIQGVSVGELGQCYDGYYNKNSWTVTDADGRYALTEVVAGNKQPTQAALVFGDILYGQSSQGGVEGFDYVTEFSGGGRTCDTATAVPVGTLDADTAMDQKGGLSGSLASVQGTTRREGDVYVYADAATQPYENWEQNPHYVWTQHLTEWEPNFSTAHLPPGRYRALFVADGATRTIGTWWSSGNRWSTATLIDVRPGVTTAGIDAAVTSQLTELFPPWMSGPAQVGSTVHGVDGDWVAPSTISYAYAWLREGDVVGTSLNYQPTMSDVGHPVSLRVTATAGGETLIDTSAPSAPVAPADTPSTTPPPTPTPTPSPSSDPTPTTTSGGTSRHASTTNVSGIYKEKRRHRRSKVVLDISVMLDDGRAPYGYVRVTDRGRVVRRLPLVQGHLHLVVPRPTRRVHTYVIDYLGNENAAPSSTTVTVDTR